MKEWFAAVDGGGTKTDLVRFSEDGTVERRVLTEGCNPNDFGWEHTRKVLEQGLDALFEDAGGRRVQLAGCFAGISGGTVGGNQPRMERLLRELLPGAQVAACGSDALNALSSGLEQQDGCVVIAGTGTVGFLRRRGVIERVGGWGYLFDKGGSGYDFGRDAVYHALCAADGRGPDTLLSGLLHQALGQPVEQAVPVLYEAGKPAVAALAPMVFRAASAGDDTAGVILRENAAELARLFNALSARFAQPVCPTVLAGSIFRDWAMLAPLVKPLLQRPHRFLLPELPPVYGSAVEALTASGSFPTPTFQHTFRDSLECCTLVHLSTAQNE